MTEWEVAHKITLPWVRSGIIGATVLGLGRALGETVAVALIGGSILHFAPNIYGSMTTIAATILTQLDGAQTDGTGFAVATLAELGLVLAVISVAVNLAGPGHHPPIVPLGPSVGPELGERWHTQAMPGTRGGAPSPASAFRIGTYLALLLIIGPAAVDPDRGGGPRRAALAVERADHAHQGHRRGACENAILGTLILMLGVLIMAGTIGVLAGIHLAELAKTAANGKRERGRCSAPPRTSCRAFPPSSWATAATWRWWSAALGLLPAARPHHPLHHGDPLHRQDHRVLAAPGAGQLPGRCRGPRDVHGVFAAQGGAQDGAARAS